MCEHIILYIKYFLIYKSIQLFLVRSGLTRLSAYFHTGVQKYAELAHGDELRE